MRGSCTLSIGNNGFEGFIQFPVRNELDKKKGRSEDQPFHKIAIESY